MAEASTVADPPIPNPADPSKPESAAETQNSNPTPKPQPKYAEQEPNPADASQAQTKKRKLEHSVAVAELRGSAYFKIRSVIKQLRPLFIEVIHAPDFQESKAAHDIRKQMKTMLELTKQLTKEAPLMGVNMEENHKEQVNNASQPQTNGEVPSSSDKVMMENDKILEKLEEGSQGTYMIGGSPVGWNFLFYLSSHKPIYYGVTKISFRARQVGN